jgi:hypothetical protein
MVSFFFWLSVDPVQLLWNLQCLLSRRLLHPLRLLLSILQQATIDGKTHQTLNKVLQHIDPRVPGDRLQRLLVFQEQFRQLKICIDAKVIQHKVEMEFTDLFFFLFSPSF